MSTVATKSEDCARTDRPRCPTFFGAWMVFGFALGSGVGLLATEIRVREYEVQYCIAQGPVTQMITQLEVRYAGWRVLHVADGGEHIENLLFVWHVRSFGIFVCACLGVVAAYVWFRLRYGVIRRAAHAAW